MSHLTLSPDALLSQLRWRYAVKRFDPSLSISDELWQVIEQSLVLTPSSFGLQPWKFIVIRSSELKEQLPAISWGQTQPRDCSHFVVMTALRDMSPDHVEQFLLETARTRGVPVESLDGYRKVVLGFLDNTRGHHLAWGSNQVYIALGQVMLTAALLGIDACPMEGIVQEKYDELLGLTQTPYTTRVCCAFGYRHPEDKYSLASKVRFEASKVIEHR